MTEADRTWIERNAVAFALGELDADAEARFRAVVADDPDFADLLASLDPGEAGHVPAALIARWGVAGRALSAGERSLVERHLQACEDCREELELVGRGGPASLSIASSSWRWTPWFGGAVLGAAAMAAFLMFASPGGPSLQGARIEVVSPRAMRGAEPPTLGLPSEARAFLLALTLPVDVEPGATASLTLIGPDAEPVLQTSLDPAPWRPASTQVVVLGDPGFEEGEYAVRLQVSGEDRARELGRFRIAHAR